jgi:uncharacterized protein (TIGR03435 family)
MAAQFHALAIALAILAGQTAAPKPAFEVATVKRNTSIEPAFSIGFQPGGRFRVVGMDVRTLITIAYRMGARLYPSQVVGGPAWMASDAYDIAAKAADEVLTGPAAEITAKREAMLQSLLEDRFKLKVHRDRREVTGYALVLARKDGALGPQLRRSTINCAVDITRCETRSLNGELTSTSMTAGALASFLASVPLKTVVVDRTGLTGMFALSLEWTPDGSDKPTLFTAIQDQLGLKLEPEHTPIEVVVIDHIERPAAD